MRNLAEKKRANMRPRSARENELLFSVIIPVYGTEAFVGETLDSVLNQDPDILARSEVLIIDDGSPDNALDICLRYEKQYPRLIKVIQQPNQGVSIARNNGIEIAEGKYIALLDSDDTWSDNVLSDVLDFFEHNSQEVDVVAIPMYFFDATVGEHPLNFKFNSGTRVIDTRREFDAIHLHAPATFLTRESIESTGLRFDATRKYSEDKLFLTRLIQSKQKYGVVSTAHLNYRRRADQSSAIQGSQANPLWYWDTLWNVDACLFYLTAVNGVVPKYVQYVVAYDLQWRIKQSAQSVLSADEEERYKRLFRSLLTYIDVDVIMALRNIFAEHKIHMLRLKYGDDPLANAEQRGNGFFYRGTRIASYNEGAKICTIHLCELEGNILRLEGYHFGMPFEGVEYGFVKNGSFLPSERIQDDRPNVEFLGDLVLDRIVYKFETKIEVGDRIWPAVRLPDGEVIKGKLFNKEKSRIPNGISTYWAADAFVIQNIRNDALKVLSNSSVQRIKRELSFWRLTVRSKTNSPKTMKKSSVFALRALASIYALFKKRELWIISDRLSSGGDNGEALFAHLCAISYRKSNIYFMVSDKSGDYKRLSKIGKVLKPGSIKHKILMLNADKVLSSHADDFIINPFKEDRNLFLDRLTFDFVFLAHGITVHDQSTWLNRFAKDIKVFVTSSEAERQSILDRDYGYSGKEVVLTGFPRYDRIDDAAEKLIMVAPTWRQNLTGDADPITGERGYNPHFTQSDYYDFYQQLIFDPRLNKAMEEYGYRAELVLHPSFYAQAIDFEGTDRFRVAAPPNDYRDYFARSSIMVTDYSSVAFDFAYLRKPVVYSQFDQQAFYQNHLWKKSYFSFEQNGFGPVTYDLASTVDALIDLMKSESALDNVYRKRVDDFFAFDDKANSERVLRAVEAL